MNLKRSKMWSSLVCGAMISLSPALALAQDGTGDGAAVTGIFSSGTSAFYSTVIGAPLTTTGGLVLLIVLVAGNSNNVSLFQQHLEANRDAVYAALYTGDAQDDGTRDLAHLFGVSAGNEDAFAALLHDDREQLAELLHGESISRDQALSFALHVASKMQSHPVLSQDVDFHLAEYKAR